MSRWRYFLSWPVLLTLMVAGTARQAWGQARFAPRYQEPQWFTFRLSQVSAGVYGEANYQHSTFQASDTRFKYLRTFIGPSLGLTGGGSIYHPNLARYYFNTDGAFGWARDEISGDASSKSQDYLYLGSASIDLDFLPEKDYRARAYASYDNSYRDNDFFSRQMVETWRAGGRANWDVGQFQISGSYDHFDETSASRYPVSFAVPPGTPPPGGSIQSTLVEDILDARIRHERESGGTSLSYTFTQYDRADPGQTGTGRIQTVGLGDSENFGDHRQHHFNADASYTHRDTLFEISDEVMARLSLRLEHYPNLDSTYDVNFDHLEIGSFKSDSLSGEAQLNHKLYESLLSSLRGTASDYEVNDSISEGYTRRYGAGISENYTKQLSDEHRLSLGASVFLEHTDQQSISTVQNERHQILPGGEGGSPAAFSFYLNFPYVDQLSIVVTDVADTFRYVLGFDYWVSTFGDRTIIQWLRPPGPGTPTAVLVDYQIEPLPGGDFDSLTQSYYARLDLWKNFLGVYGRVSLYENNASAEMQILEYMTYSVGLDLSWRWFRTGAEYMIYDSTDSDYRSIRLFQSGSWQLDGASAFSLSLTEAWIEYLDRNRQNEEDYRAIARYHRILTRRLGLDLDAGVAYQKGQDVDQLLTAIRPSIRYIIGRTTINVGYEYEYDLFVNQEERMKNLLYVRLRRTF